MKYIVTLNGKDYEVEVDELNEAIVTNIAPASAMPVAPSVTAAPSVAASPAAPVASAAPAVTVSGGTDVKAPMPGTILSVNVTAGQDVKTGDVLFVLEAMKMENEIVAPCDGKISAVLTAKGNTVATDAVLASIGGSAVAAPTPAPVSAPAPVAAPTPAPASAPAAAPAPVNGTGTPVNAPMPGTILSVNIAEGQAVSEGDVLFVLEAMKMENEIVAPVSGTVTKVATAKGNTVATDAVLAFIG